MNIIEIKKLKELNRFLLANNPILWYSNAINFLYHSILFFCILNISFFVLPEMLVSIIQPILFIILAYIIFIKRQAVFLRFFKKSDLFFFFIYTYFSFILGFFLLIIFPSLIHSGEFNYFLAPQYTAIMIFDSGLLIAVLIFQDQVTFNNDLGNPPRFIPILLIAIIYLSLYLKSIYSFNQLQKIEFWEIGDFFVSSQEEISNGLFSMGVAALIFWMFLLELIFTKIDFLLSLIFSIIIILIILFPLGLIFNYNLAPFVIISAFMINIVIFYFTIAPLLIKHNHKPL